MRMMSSLSDLLKEREMPILRLTSAMTLEVAGNPAQGQVAQAGGTIDAPGLRASQPGQIPPEGGPGADSILHELKVLRDLNATIIAAPPHPPWIGSGNAHDGPITRAKK